MSFAIPDWIISSIAQAEIGAQVDQTGSQFPEMVQAMHGATVREGQKNDVYAIGAGGRYKLTKRFSLNAEYYYVLDKYTQDHYQNSLAVGVDIETGGHIFQLLLTNSIGMIEKQFIAETTDHFFKGGIYFGFNINRNFTVKQRRLH